MSKRDPSRPPWWLVLDTLTVLGGAAFTWYLLSQKPPEVTLRHDVERGPLADAGGAASWPFVSIIVPA